MIVIIFIISPKFIFYKTSLFRRRKYNKPIVCVRGMKIQIGDLAWLPVFSAILVSQAQHMRTWRKQLLPLFSHNIQLWNEN